MMTPLRIFAFAFLMMFGLSPALQAQQTVTVSTDSGYVDDVFYSLDNGEVGRAARKNWDLAFMINASSGIEANTASGARVYRPAFEAADFATADTAGNVSGSDELYGAASSWSSGALNSTADTSQFEDIGWGYYDIQTHVITGDSVYFVQTVQDEWYKLLVEDRAAGEYAFRVADLAGTLDTTWTLDTQNYSDKNFAYFSFEAGGQILDREPAKTSWDLLFTRYTAMLPFGPGMLTPYGVTGVLANAGLEVAELRNVDPAVTDTGAGTYETAADVIGYDWKSYDLNTDDYIIEDSLVYLVKDGSGSVWRLVFTDFGGNANGDYTFEKTALTTDREAAADVSGLKVYPNPAADRLYITTEAGAAQGAVIDNTGRTLRRFRIRGRSTFNAHQLNVSDLPAGAYTLRLSSDDSLRSTRFIVR